MLRENVSIRNMVLILESIAVYVSVSKDIRFHIEKARLTLANQICSHYADSNRTIHILTLEPSLEQAIIENKAFGSSGQVISIVPINLHSAWIKALGKHLKKMTDKGFPHVILCSEAARYLVKSSVEREFPDLAVLAVFEISPDFDVELVDVIRVDAIKDMDLKNTKTQNMPGIYQYKVEDEQKDPERTAYQWTIAAEQGDTDAMIKLGTYFYQKTENRM